MNLTTRERAPSLTPATAANSSSSSPEVGASAESHTSPPVAHPAQYLVTIEATRSWVPLNLGDLWAYRELLYFMTWRDLKVRYKQTALGIGWVVMQPLLTTLIFSVFLGKLARLNSDDIPYPIFVFAGLLPWTFFSGAVTNSGNSLVGSAHLITKVYFPRLIIPAAAIGARLVDFAIAFAILILMMLYYRVPLTLSILMLPVLIGLITLFALAVGTWTSALNVKYRDVGVALPVLIQLWMFVSPVLYPASYVPEEYRWIYALNPIVGIVENLRSALFDKPFDWVALALSFVITFALLLYAAYDFRRMERTFADII